MAEERKMSIVLPWPISFCPKRSVPKPIASQGYVRRVDHLCHADDRIALTVITHAISIGSYNDILLHHQSDRLKDRRGMSLLAAKALVPIRLP